MVRRVLLLFPGRRRGMGQSGARLAPVPLPLFVRRHVRGRRGVRARRVPRRVVPGQHPVSLFGHRLHHAGILLVCHQQDVPVRVQPLRVLRHVFAVHRRQCCRHVIHLQVRHRDKGQDVTGDPRAAAGYRWTPSREDRSKQ